MTNKQGWHEKQKPILTDKGIEQKAPNHRKAAIGSSYQTTLRQPLVSEEEQDFISHPSKYINEFAPLYDQALKTSSVQQKWESRKDYISLIIKKSADHSIKTKEAAHFIMYLREIKEDLKAKEPEKSKSKHNIVYSSVDLPTSNSSPIDAELQKVQVIIDNFKTREDYNQGMHVLGQISLNYHPSISQQEKMREMAQILGKKANELEKQNNSTYDDLVKQVYLAITIQKLDDLHQDANRAEVKGQITFAQLNEIYALINKRDEQLNKEIRARREFLQSQYHVGDILERLPDVDSVIKPGIYKITEIIPHKIMSFGNTSPSELRTEYEYRIAGIKDNTEIRIGGMILTAEHLSNSFKKISSQEVGEMNKSDIETSKKLLFDGIKQIKTIQALNELDTKFHELISKGGLDVTSEHVSEITQALSAKRKELSGTSSSKIIKSADEYELSNLKYEAEHKPPEMLPPKEYEDTSKYTWGLTEAEAIKKYTEKELKKYQYNIDFTNKQKAELEEIAKSKPHVLLTKAQIQKQFPEKADEYIRDLWTYKTKKSDYEKNVDSARFWQAKVDKINSGEWQKINANYLKEQWQKEVKEAIKHGKPVPYDIIKTYPEFTKAQNARQIYEKGKLTSHGNVSIAVDRSHQENTGVKIKKQNGSALDEKTADDVIKTLSQFQSIVGDITPIMKREDLTISHTGQKHPYLSTAAGTYYGSDITISLGAHTGAHELNHFLDETAKKRHPDQPLYDYNLIAFAKKNMNGGKYAIERALSLSKNKSPEDLEDARNLRYMLGSYWERVEEIWSRLIEEYVSYKNKGLTVTDRIHHPYELYIRTPAYWDDITFIGMIPQIEKELQRKIELAKN